MKIGIIGVGYIGKTLALKLAQAGHEVTVANSGGPENVDRSVLATGARAVTSKQAVQDKDVIILSIPLDRTPEITSLFADVSMDIVVIDTSNYIPARDGEIERIDAGLVESLWVQQQLARPIAKAWNAILAHSFATKGKPAGNPDRIAIPVSADRDIDREITLKLVDETGFDAFDAGSLADSWRHQPAAPAYCTDLTITELQTVIYTAEKDRLPKRRDLSFRVLTERFGHVSPENIDWEFVRRLNRVLYL